MATYKYRRPVYPGKRLLGVDAARAVAIVGMVMVHFGPFPIPETMAGSIYAITQGRSSVLFALLAGVAVTLASGSGSRSDTAHTKTRDVKLNPDSRLRGKLIFRAALLLPLGLWLQRLEHGALVILQYYALYFVLAALVLGASRSFLLRAATVVLIGGPMVYLLFANVAPASSGGYPAVLGDPLAKVVRELLLTGYYPLVTWAAPLLFGMWLGRVDLRSPVIRRRLLAVGAVAAAGAAIVSSIASSFVSNGVTTDPRSTTIWQFLVTDEPHSESFLWMAGAMGSACLVLGAALIVADLMPRLMWPLAATGQLALTVYVTHLVGLDLTGSLLDRSEVLSAIITVAVFMTLAAAFSVRWRESFGRGPLEVLLEILWHVMRRLLEPGTSVSKRTEKTLRD